MLLDNALSVWLELPNKDIDKNIINERFLIEKESEMFLFFSGTCME